MHQHSWKLLFGCLLMAAILVGCQTKKSILLEETLCEPPCWQNILPGGTSSKEALQILLASPYLASRPSAVPRKVDDIRSYNSWTFQKNIRETSGGITFFNDTVAYIEFDVFGNSRIGELIDYYGEPEFISVITGWEDSKWLRVCWIYPDEGVLITHFDHNWRPKGNYASIKPDLPVYQVYYFDPSLYEILVKTVFFQLTKQEVVKKSIQPWVDYGLIPYTEE